MKKSMKARRMDDSVSGGIATFSDLSIDLVGDGYTLHATTTGLTNADSVAFRITA